MENIKCKGIILNNPLHEKYLGLNKFNNILTLEEFEELNNINKIDFIKAKSYYIYYKICELNDPTDCFATRSIKISKSKLAKRVGLDWFDDSTKLVHYYYQVNFELSYFNKLQDIIFDYKFSKYHRGSWE